MPAWQNVPTQSVGGIADASWANAIVSNMSDSGWTVPTLLNSFGTFGGNGVRMIGNQVFIEMSTDAGGSSGTTIFQLPTGMYPAQDLIIPGVSNGPNALVAWLISAGGGVMVDWVTISGDVTALYICGSFLVD